MGEGGSDQHKDAIQPGSKEDQEITEALFWALSEVDRNNKERYLREKERAKMDPEWRVREGLPLGDDCYFARFTAGMHIRDEDLRDLWETDRVAVHLTAGGVTSTPLQHGDLDPKAYPSGERLIVSALQNLSERGGYVWFENRSGRRAKVGVVRPGAQIEGVEARWSESHNPKHKGKTGTATTLLALSLERVHAVHFVEATMLRASRPVVSDHSRNSLIRWNPACGRTRLISLVHSDKDKHPLDRWNDLPPDLQVTVCADFLRHHENPAYPRLKHLLLNPTTMNQKDVDIYGIAEDGTEIMAQTPFRPNRDREGFEARKKMAQLQKYKDTDAKVVCFIPSFRRDLEDAGQDFKLFEDHSQARQDSVLLISVQEVLDWVERQPAYAKSLFPG